MLQFLTTLLIAVTATSAQAAYVAGFNLTENGGALIYDASTDPTAPTEAQKRILEAKKLGANHIILNVRATMKGGTSNEIIPVTPPSERSKEGQRMVRLIKYIKAQGMTVGIRPIFFVVGPQGQFPFEEIKADGTRKLWWHGNIQPSDPNRWFESFRIYLDQYLLISKATQVDEFTIGAELYSMTVGLEDQWKAYPYGFPGRWLELLKYVRSKLPKARLMYDINFTDDEVMSGGGLAKTGGELERWRYRLVDLANPSNQAEAVIWQDLVAFWTGLDAVGIDMYRSLASDKDQLAKDFNGLSSQLKMRADTYATQLDTIVSEIALTLGKDQPIHFKEVGYRSVDNGFIDPFTYAGAGKYNELHQAAAYKALFDAFWAPRWGWFAGMNLWDLPVDPRLHGKNDNGFSPIGKTMTENILKNYYLKGQP